jgi:hypothetical protein
MHLILYYIRNYVIFRSFYLFDKFHDNLQCLIFSLRSLSWEMRLDRIQAKTNKKGVQAKKQPSDHSVSGQMVKK